MTRLFKCEHGKINRLCPECKPTPQNDNGYTKGYADCKTAMKAELDYNRVKIEVQEKFIKAYDTWSALQDGSEEAGEAFIQMVEAREELEKVQSNEK